jgi:3-oxoacyl-[acyl-carrier protein] reductase
MGMLDLSGRVALVTGAASGIGRACALTLARCGAHVVAADINLPGAEQAAAQAGAALAVGVDVGDPASVDALAARVQGVYGGADILVNAAGIVAYARGIGAVSLEEWDRVLQVNLRGTWLVCRALIEAMKLRRDGRIINFASLAARIGGLEAGIHYASSKAGLIGLTRTLAREGGPYGITANCVAPGIIATPPVIRQVADHEEVYTRQIPLGRLGRPEDVANAVAFLASPLAAYVSGVVLDINGGQYMG